MIRSYKRGTIQILKCAIGCGLAFFVIKLLLIGDESKPLPEFADREKLMVDKW